MIPGMISCRRATELLSRQLDEKLTKREWIALRCHVAICKGCQQFEKQLLTLRGMSARFMDYQQLNGDKTDHHQEDTAHQDDTNGI